MTENKRREILDERRKLKHDMERAETRHGDKEEMKTKKEEWLIQSCHDIKEQENIEPKKMHEKKKIWKERYYEEQQNY